MSYTSFAYANLRVDRQRFAPGDSLRVSVDVTNTGNRTGKEAVLLYSSDVIASMTPDGRRLRGFEKVELQPQQTTTVTFTLPASDMAFVGWDGQWHLEPGDFILTVANHSLTVTCVETE